MTEKRALVRGGALDQKLLVNIFQCRGFYTLVADYYEKSPVKASADKHYRVSRNYTRVLRAFALCVPIHGLSFLTKYVVAVYLGIDISFYDICLILALVWVITSIPITISGAGVRELSMIYFLSFYGVDAELATALSVYFYLVSVILGVMGLFFLLNSPQVPSQMTKEAEEQA